MKWLKFGDKNSRFFHASTVARRNRNKIIRIKDEEDQWLEGQEAISNGIRNYFSTVYAPDVNSDFTLIAWK